MPAFEEYCDEIAPLWESHWLTNRGMKHKELEKLLQEYLGTEYVTLFVNGHSALECVLETMELGRDGRNEVVTTPFTFASTTHAIVRKGLRPVFADVKRDDYTLDPDSIKSRITDRTCAILPVHVYGNLCDVEAIQRIADEHGLKVIYDAAHAFGVKKDGIPVSRFGDASMLSFHATKVFNTIEGGAISHADPGLRDRLVQWRNFGIIDETHVEYPGGNAKLNEFAAAMGICNLRHIDDEIAKRKRVVERYWDKLPQIHGVTFYKPPASVTYNYAYMPILINENQFGLTRDELYDRLRDRGIGTRKYFYPLTSEFDCYDFDCHDTPIALDISRRILALPLYADLDLDAVDFICSSIEEISEEARK